MPTQYVTSARQTIRSVQSLASLKANLKTGLLTASFDDYFNSSDAIKLTIFNIWICFYYYPIVHADNAFPPIYKR